ncbi:MAG: hypothetical protein AB7K09_20995 [Planctomycetota bacterium]
MNSPSPKVLIPRRVTMRGSVTAIARLTAGEALRSRFLIAVLIIGFVGMLSTVAQGAAVDATNRVQLLRQSIIQTVSFVTTFSLLFLAAFALPTDLETRRIYTLVAKPVSRSTVFLGRFLGFVALALLLTVLLGVSGQVLLRIAAATATEPTSLAVSPRTLPVMFDAWGADEGSRSSGRGLPTITLDGPEEAGFVAVFAGVERGAFDDEGPRLWLRTGLRLHRGRHIREQETGELRFRAPRQSKLDATVVTINLADRDSQTVRIPWSAVGPFAHDASLSGVVVEFSLTESPFSAVIEPDSAVLLGRGVDPAPAWTLVLMTELARVVFLISLVLAASAAFTPYTSVLIGFFAMLMMGVASTFRTAVERYSDSLAHAHQLQYRTGRSIEFTMQFGEWLFGDPTDPGARWHWVTWMISAMPDSTRFPISADFIAGFQPTAADALAAVWMFGAWTIGAVLFGMLCFTLREIP